MTVEVEIKQKYFELMMKEIKTIQDDKIREFAEKLLENVPDYFFTVPASSSGKYHPKNDLGVGGLVRHSITVKRMLEHLLVPNGYFDNVDKDVNEFFSEYKAKDLLIVAALFHDCMKSGTQEDWEKNPSTTFFHPVLASNFIMLMSVKYNFRYDFAQFIADAIMSHMGQWNQNRDKTSTLPLPKTDAQKVLHLADYLASRKDINMDVEAEE